jgi:DNA-binding transcriptional MerR regulator
VGQVAERSGARPSALRFYERQGLISTDRTAGNQRLAQHLRRELSTRIHDLNRLLGQLGSEVTPPAASA